MGLFCVYVIRLCLKKENFKFFNLNKSFDHPPEPLFFSLVAPAISSTQPLTLDPSAVPNSSHNIHIPGKEQGRKGVLLWRTLLRTPISLWCPVLTAVLSGVRSVLMATCPAKHPEFIYCRKMREQTLDSTNSIC